MAKHEIDEYGEQAVFGNTTRKRAKRHVRSDHKHVYEKVLLKRTSKRSEHVFYYVYNRCTICGALRRDEHYNGMVHDERVEGGWLCHFITPEDFPDLPIVEQPEQ